APEIPARLLARGAVAARQQPPGVVEEEDGARAQGFRVPLGGVVKGLRRLAQLRQQRLGAGLLPERAHLPLARAGLRVAVALEDHGHGLEVRADLLLGDAPRLVAADRDGEADGQREEAGGAEEEAGPQAEA